MAGDATRSDEPLRLISIGPSHYCEKARWALERAFLKFTEDKHAPGAHIPVTKGLPGGTSCPKVVIGTGPQQKVLGSSHEILEFADKHIENEDERLYSSDPEKLQLEQSWETKFDDKLGPHVRRYAYSYLLFNKSSYELLAQGASSTERTVVWFLMPVLRRMLYRGLGCNKPGSRERSLEAIETVFKEVEDTLADGRPYICGSRFTAADLALAALGGPLVAPPQLPTYVPKVDDCPAEMATVMKRLQGTPAGQHILKMYATKRPSPGGK
jgi:glutathione S-transferase